MSGQINEAEVARIAKGLTKAQRAVLLTKAAPITCDRVAARHMGVTGITLNALEKVGLVITHHDFWDESDSVFPVNGPTAQFTPLGLAVRAYLERQP